MPSPAKSARRVALSDAERMRDALEASGDQPKLANLDTGWFAVAYKKWVGLVDRARRDRREGPNLIVYRTNTNDPRDHYVIPFAVTSRLLTDATAPLREDGKRRWELNLQAGRLKVTHGASSVDVTQYHRVQLPGEVEPVQADGPEDVDDDEVFFDKHEGRRVLVAHRERERDQALVQKARQWAAAQPEGLACRVCGFDFERAYGDQGRSFIEIHHAVPLATYEDEGRATRLQDLVAVCSNCHRMLHRRRPWLTTAALSSLRADRTRRSP